MHPQAAFAKDCLLTLSCFFLLGQQIGIRISGIPSAFLLASSNGTSGIQSAFLLASRNGTVDPCPSKSISQLRTVTTTPGSSRQSFLPPIPNELKILTLGGSNSRGGHVDPTTDSYSRILEQHYGAVVDNLAIPATGAYYPARCLQSMVEGGPDAMAVDPSIFLERVKSADASETGIIGRDARPYDVINVEFSVNGVGLLDVLLLRLRERYPDAIIIYIDLMPWKDRHMSQYLGNTVGPKIKEAVNAVGGHIYRIPRPDIDSLDNETRLNAMYHSIYASDDRHLNQRGHLLVASEIISIIHTHWVEIPESPRLGTWGSGGDLCYSWFASGVIPNGLNVVTSGGDKVGVKEVTKKKEDPKNARDFLRSTSAATKKYALEIPFGGKVTFELFLPPDSPDAPLKLMHLKTGSPPLYPNAKIHLYNTHNKRKEASILKQRPIKDIHITQEYSAGYAAAGRNILTVEPMSNSSLPLRIIGVVVSPASLAFEVN